MNEYIHGHTDAVLQAHRTRTAENSSAHLLPLLRPGMTVLDVGCGEGWITRDLAHLVAPGAVVGVDVSEEVIGRAREGGDLPDNLTFAASDLFDLDFPDASFDAVHIHQVLHHLVDPVAALTSLARLVRPGGVMAAREGDYAAAWWYPASNGWETWQRAFLEVGRAQGTDLTIGRQLVRVARDAGFEDFSMSATAWTYPGLQSVEHVADTWAQRLTDPHFVQLAEEVTAASADELADAAAELRRWAGHRDAFFAHPHGEIVIRVPA